MPAPSKSAASRTLKGVPSDASSPSAAAARGQKRQKRAGANPPVTQDPAHVWENDLNIEEVFADATGAARIEKIFQIFGDPKDEYVDVPWFQQDSRPTLISDQLNRPLQQSTVRDYERRIFESGLAVDCSGCLPDKDFFAFLCRCVQARDLIGLV